MALPPTTGAPLNLYLPPFDYGDDPNDDTWDVPANDNWTALNTAFTAIVLYSPIASQTVAQPDGTFFNFNFPIVYGATPSVRFGVNANLWDSAISRTAAGVFSFDTNSVGNGQGSINANVVDASGGFQYNGGAPAGHILIGDGTHYVDSATLPAGIVFYQVVQQAGVSVTQRNKLNFLSPLTVVDDPINLASDVGLANSGVTAGSYTNPTITVGSDGRVIAAENGSLTVTQSQPTRSFGIDYVAATSIVVTVSVQGDGGTALAYVDGVEVAQWSVVNTGTNSACGTFVVPQGKVYSVAGTGTISLQVWTEWAIG